MPTLRAWQHIYANVERDRSPTKSSGFQTLFYSHDGLSPNEVAEIEERVFYVFGEYNPVKRVFFKLSTDKIAIGQILPIEGRDAAGREGLYFAHTLIFSLSEFQAFDVHPMQCFAQATLLTTLDAAFAKGDRGTGNIHPISFDVEPEKVHEITWDMDVFRKLMQLAINHESLEKNRSAVAFVGATQTIEGTLASIMQLLPPQLLYHCTFDTFFERGGKLSFTYYWSVGFKSRPNEPFYAVVDADEKSIVAPGDQAGVATSFGRWVDAKLAANNTEEVFDNKREAFEICHYLDNQQGNVERIASLDPVLLDAVLQPNDRLVKEKIRQQIEKALPALLAKRVFDAVIESLQAGEKIQRMANGFETLPLLNVLYARYEKTSFQPPVKEERQTLAEVLQHHEHKALRWLSLIWGGASWENPVTRWRIQAGLEEMDPQEYQDFWALAIPAELVDPMDLLVEGKEALFTTMITRYKLLEEEEVPRLVKILVKENEVPTLETLTPYLSMLDEKKIKKIKRRIKGVAEVPEAFLETVNLLAP